MSRFKIGDTVYIKPWEKLEPLLSYDSEEGVWRCPETNVWWVPEMIELCGRPLVILSYDEEDDAVYIAELDDDDDTVLLCDTFLEYDPPNDAVLEALSRVVEKYNVTFELDPAGPSLKMHSPGNETVTLHTGAALFKL